MIGEERATPAVVGQRGDRRHDIGVAHEAAESAFHPPDRNKRSGGHAVAALDVVEQAGILPFQALAALGDGGAAALGHECVERKLEALLAPVGPSEM